LLPETVEQTSSSYKKADNDVIIIMMMMMMMMMMMIIIEDLYSTIEFKDTEPLEKHTYCTFLLGH